MGAVWPALSTHALLLDTSVTGQATSSEDPTPPREKRKVNEPPVIKRSRSDPLATPVNNRVGYLFKEWPINAEMPYIETLLHLPRVKPNPSGALVRDDSPASSSPPSDPTDTSGMMAAGGAGAGINDLASALVASDLAGQESAHLATAATVPSALSTPSSGSSPGTPPNANEEPTGPEDDGQPRRIFPEDEYKRIYFDEDDSDGDDDKMETDPERYQGPGAGMAIWVDVEMDGDHLVVNRCIVPGRTCGSGRA
ncbi:hypothetical protein DL93DRAFT_2086340, partial [Clavulina sp. PMI_390]